MKIDIDWSNILSSDENRDGVVIAGVRMNIVFFCGRVWNYFAPTQCILDGGVNGNSGCDTDLTLELFIWPRRLAEAWSTKSFIKI